MAFFRVNGKPQTSRRFQLQEGVLEEMAPFRWPSVCNDIALAVEVAARRPKSPTDWKNIARILSEAFSTEDRQVEIRGRACRERLDRMIAKYKEADSKSLQKSGTEEEYTQLCQLLEDIYTYRRDIADQRNKEKENKKQKEIDDQQKGMEMRAAALIGMDKRKHELDPSDEDNLENSSSSDEDVDNGSSASTHTKMAKKGPKSKKRCRASKRTALDILTHKYNQKAELKEKELHLRKMELEFQQKKYETEAEERRVKLQLELEERRAVLELLKIGLN